MSALLSPKRLWILVSLNLGLTAVAQGAGVTCAEFLRSKPIPAVGLVAESLQRHHGTKLMFFEENEWNAWGFYRRGVPEIHVKSTLKDFQKQAIILHEAVHDTTDRKIAMNPVFANTIRGIWFKSEAKHNLVYALPKDQTDIKIPYGYGNGFQRDERLAWRRELSVLNRLQKDLWKHQGFDGGFKVEWATRERTPQGKNFENADNYFLGLTHEALSKLVEGDTSSHAARLEAEFLLKDEPNRFHSEPGSKSKEIVTMRFYVPKKGTVAGFFTEIPVHAPEGKLPETRELRIQKALQTIEYAMKNPFPPIEGIE